MSTDVALKGWPKSNEARAFVKTVYCTILPFFGWVLWWYGCFCIDQKLNDEGIFVGTATTFGPPLLIGIGAGLRAIYKQFLRQEERNEWKRERASLR